MTKLMKKLTIGNPLANFEMWNELEEYESIETPEELGAFYHRILDNCKPEQTMLERFIYAMIDYSTGDTNQQLISLCKNS